MITTRIKKLLLTGLAAVTLAVALSIHAPAVAYADPATDASKAAACQGSGGTIMDGGRCSTPGPSLNRIIANVINIMSVLVGVAAVIMMIIGGFKYVTANGDTGNVNGAKQTILYALIGLVIVAFAQFIVQFVIQEATGNARADDGTVAIVRMVA